MGKRFNFTKPAIAALPPAAKGKRDWYRDEKVRGLYLMVTAAGARSFYGVRWIEEKTEQFKLGVFPDMTVELARQKAETLNYRVAKGENPAAERRELRADPTFGELFDWWLARLAGKRSNSYLQELARQKKGDLADLCKMKATLIKKAHVRKLHEDVGAKSPYMANRLLATIRAVYNKAIAHERIGGTNPAGAIEAFEERERERRLLPGEVGRFLEAVAAEADPDIRDVVLLALYTGARRSQVLGMRWDGIDLAGKTWSVRITKNGHPQVLPLEEQEIEILTRRKARTGGSPWVFPSSGSSGHLVSPTKGWTRIRKAAGMEDLRLHDLRRTLGSFMADAGVPELVIGRTLNHLSPAATKIYTRLAINPVRKGKAAGIEEMLASV